MEEMDMLQGVKDAVNEAENQGPPPIPVGEEGFQMPSLEEMLEALEKMNLTGDDKEGLKNILMQRSQMGAEMDDMATPGISIWGNSVMFYMLLVAFIGLVIVVGYLSHLYFNWQRQKESRREQRRNLRRKKRR